MSGAIPLKPSTLSPLGRPQPSVDTTRVGTLTDREREVLLLMARGLDNGQIAAELFVSEATIGTHVGHVLSKLDARSRMQAIVVAYESGRMRQVCNVLDHYAGLQVWPNNGQPARLHI